MEKTLSFDDITLVPSYSGLDSRNDASIHLEACGEVYQSPIIPSAMISTSSCKMLRYCHQRRGMLVTVHRYFDDVHAQINHAQKSGLGFHDVFFAVGSTKKHKKWIDTLLTLGIEKFHVDMAHGDSMHCTETIRYIRRNCPNAKIMAGNVATGEGFARLEDAGANLIRCGVASGSICSTALNTGFGLPIVTTLMECSEICQQAKIIADGGVRTAGDIAKAIAVGAHFVMVGKLLASTSYADGATFDKNLEYCDNKDEIMYKEYCGMASLTARKCASHQSTNVSIEGVEGLVRYTGETPDVLDRLESNLRASLSYCGARNWSSFRGLVEIRGMSLASQVEKQTHLDHQYQV
jgi:IMP dehydrogenase